MQRIKKVHIFICSLLFLIVGLFFVGCNKADYSKVTLTAYVDDEIVSSVELNQFDETVIQFRMNNYTKKLNGEVTVAAIHDSIKCFDYKATYQGNGITNILVSATHGGAGHLIVTSIDSGIKSRVDIKVKEFSDTINNDDKKFYVTQSSPLVPSENDFVFSEHSNIKEVDYYIYGIASSQDEPLNIEDLFDTATNDYKRKFTTIYLRRVREKDRLYLIFDDGQGGYFTLQQADNIEIGKNVSLEKIRLDDLTSVEQADFDEYTSVNGFPDRALSVNLGDRFTLIARYVNSFDSDISVQRDFIVLNDLSGDTFDYSYQYFDISATQVPDGEVYAPKEGQDFSIILVPNAENSDGLNYKKVNLKIEIPSTSEKITMKIDKPTYNGLEVVNIIEPEPERDESNSKSIYNIELSNISTVTAYSTLNIHFYYEGFENIDDVNVNYTLSIQLQILYEPKEILINNSSDYDHVYNFYNYYENRDSGWQKFLINYSKKESVIDCFEFSFDPDIVMMKYGQTICESGQISLTWDQIKGGVFFKGKNGISLSNGNVIDIKLIYTVFEEKEIQAQIKYNIVQGSRNIDYDDDYFKTEGIIYIDLNHDSDLPFERLFTDGDFESFTCTPYDDYSKSIVDVYPNENGKIFINNKNYLSLKFKPKKANDLKSPANYTITLDNGKTFTIQINVVEQLQSIKAIIDGSLSIASMLESEQVGNIGDDTYKPQTTTLYIRNDLDKDDNIIEKTNSIKFVANDNPLSNAITRIMPSSERTEIFEAPYSELGVKITTFDIGSSAIDYTIYHNVVENFKLQRDVTTKYTVKVVSYSLLSRLNIYKTADGNGEYKDPTSSLPSDKVLSSAGSATIFSGETSPLNKRTIKLKLVPDRGYLFFNPSQINEGLNVNDISLYEEAEFDLRFVYWTTSASRVRQAGRVLDPNEVMYYSEDHSNEYDISGFGTFNTQTLEFVANQDFALQTLTLTATVKQFDRYVPFTITIYKEEYQDVETISIRDSQNKQEITLSALHPQTEIIVYVDPKDATNPQIKPVFTEPYVTTSSGNQTAYLFGEDRSGIKVEPSGLNSFIVTLTLDQAFLNSPLAQEDAQFIGELKIGAANWFNGDIENSYYTERLKRSTITIYYSNGSINAPYEIESAQDVLLITPGHHYKINRTIDLNMLSQEEKQKLPLDTFDATITGNSELAAIEGIEISSAREDGSGLYYGLFKSLASTAVIDGVKFKGKIDIDMQQAMSKNVYIGLLAGINEGSLINVGIELTEDSNAKLNVSGVAIAFVGAVVGQNRGLILQDYIAYAGKTIDGEVYEGRLKGQTPNILLYSDYDFTISSNSSSSLTNLYAGGITGQSIKGNNTLSFRRKFIKDGATFVDSGIDNTFGSFTFKTGSIIKLDADTDGSLTEDKADDITLYGYSNYLAYLDLKIISRFNVFAGMIAGQATGDIIAYKPGLDEENGLVSYTIFLTDGSGLDEPIIDYKAGKGIVVGGSIIDESHIGDNNAIERQYIGGVAGQLGDESHSYVDESSQGHSLLNGLTTRVSVLGSGNVGAIAGYIFTPSTFQTPAIAIQATDRGETGIYSSMVARVWQYVIDDNDYFAFASFDGEKMTANFNYVAFGRFSANATEFIKNTEEYNYIESYVSRKLLLGNSETNIKYISKEEYLGDFIVASSLERGLSYTANDLGYVYARFQEVNEQSIGVEYNKDGFSQFMYIENGVELTANNIFYMHYFASNGFVYQEEGSDITESQDYLDKFYNTVAPSSSLYPFKVFDTQFTMTSESSNLVKVDQSGKIIVSNSGIASLRLSSILNTNNEIQIYIYIVNYFDKNEEKSIIYPQNSNVAIETEQSPKIYIRGDTTLSVYVRPTNTSKVEKSDSSIQEINSRGILLDNGANIRLKSNQTVSSFLKVYRASTDENVDANIDGQDVVYVYNSLDNEKCSAKDELSVNMLGQTISFNHTDKTIESKDNQVVYIATFDPVIRVQINGVEYFARVNSKVENSQLHYLRGAQSISAENFYRTTLNTANSAKTKIKVLSSREEQVPYVEILKNYENSSTLLWTSDPDVEIYDNYGRIVEKDQVFFVTFTQPKKTTTPDGMFEYIWDTEIKFNTNCNAFKNKVGDEIYGSYTIRFAASTDISKSFDIEVILERTNAQKATIENFSDISVAGPDANVSNIAIPGQFGLLAITITPQDCDFDTITIENDVLNSQDGNGLAVFSLVAYDSNSQRYVPTTIEGRPIGLGGVRFNKNDIIAAYSKAPFRPFDGVVYIRYKIGTLGVQTDGKSKFNVTVGSTSAPAVTEPITLTLKVQYHANAEIVNKDPLSDESNAENTYMTYRVARGLRYELQVNDIWGFTQDDVDISIDPRYQSLASIVEENGRKYVQITKDEIDYANYSFEGNNSFAYARITVQATQLNGELTRYYTSYTDLYIYEYVVNYDETDENSDIVFEMGDGYINVLIGSRQDLSIDMLNFIEYDDSIPSVLDRVNQFQRLLTTQGNWYLQTSTADTFVNSYKLQPESDRDMDYNDEYVEIQGLSVTPIRVHRALNSRIIYRFTFDARFNFGEDGQYKLVSVDSAGTNIKTIFTLNVFQSSSLDTPIPISDYTELTQMNEDSDYILTNHIEIPAGEYQPINVEFSSLDGNGYSLILGGQYDFGSATRLAIFDTISSGTMLKNITISLSSDVKFKTSASSAYTASLLAGINYGVITNCEVAQFGVTMTYTAQGLIDSVITMDRKFTFSTPLGNENNYKNINSIVAGLVATNAGYITNSRSYVNIESSYSISGFVGTNSGVIASSYFREGKLTAHYGDAGFVVAGLVLSNQSASSGSEGKILTSYTSGYVEGDYIFSLSDLQLGGQKSTSYIQASSYYSAGFVYSNGGQISDCYSNIPIYTATETAGFVYSNGGEISNCFTTSVLPNSHSLSFAFSKNNSVIEESRIAVTANESVGTFKNCYYFGNNEADGEDGYYKTVDENFDENWKINEDIASINFDGISRLNRAQFSTESEDFDDNFGDFAVYDLQNANHDSVWFYSNNTTSMQDEYSKIFNGQRLELVSANLIAYSRRVIASKNEDDKTGQVIYNYKDSGCDPRGSLRNPYIIRDASDLENYMKMGCTSTNENYNYYRLVSDIRYAEFNASSSLYNISFYGTIEGNGMVIEDIILTSADKMKYAGLFAKLGRDFNYKGVLMNFDIQPSEDMMFSNTSIVGGIAGQLSYGYVFNINMGSEDETYAITGNNFVGGLFGKANGNYKIFNCSSNLSVVSNFMPDLKQSYESSSANEAMFSYSGGLVGYASQRGQSSIENCKVQGVAVIMGARTGLAFGGIGRQVEVDNLQIQVSQDLVVRSFEYAGFVAGESHGDISNVTVQAQDDQIISPFALIPAVPTSVGGFAGVLNGGSLNYINIDIDFDVVADESAGDYSRVNYIGGIAGEQNGQVDIQKTIVNGNINSSGKVTAGAIGQVNGKLTLSEVAVKSTSLTMQGFVTEPYIGGLIAKNDGNVVIKNSYCLSNLSIDCYSYGAAVMTAHAGGFVGDGIDNITEMENCYFSGNINVTLDDKRSSKDVGQYSPGPESSQIQFLPHIGPTGTYNVVGYLEHDEDESYIKNVYYYGIKEQYSGGGAMNYLTNNEKYILEYSAIGLSLMDYNTQLGYPSQVNPSKDLLNGVFNYYYCQKLDKTLFYEPTRDRFYEVMDAFSSAPTGDQHYFEDNDKDGSYSNGSEEFTKNELTEDAVMHAVWESHDGGLPTLVFEREIELWLQQV